MAPYVDAVDDARDDEGGEAERELRDERVEADRSGEAEQRERQQDRAGGRAEGEGEGETGGARGHEERVQDVVRGDDAGALGGRGAGLEERIEGDGEEPAGDG